MKPIAILTCAAALLALTACNKKRVDETAANAPVQYANVKPPQGGDWTDVINETPDGGVMMGNPNAKVHLLEIASLGCPFCKHFEDVGAPHLVDYVKTGKLSWEFRPYLIHGPVDMAADLIVRCDDPSKFFPLVRALYADQEKWMSKVEATPPAKLQEMQSLPTNQVFVAFANLAGLQDWAAARGLPPAKSNQCLTNQKMIDREVDITSAVNNQYPDFKGTPSFVLNGTMVDVSSVPLDKVWPTVDAKIKAALGASDE
jgi:protein-disulfide isomerase